MKFLDAMNELASAAGMGPMAADDAGGTTLLFDGEHEVTFSPAADGGVMLQCEVGDAGILGDGACRALLESSFSETGGAAFAIHRALGKVVLWKICGEFESRAAIEKAVNDFLGQVVSWKKKLADGDLGAPSAAESPAAMGFPGGFMAV